MTKIEVLKMTDNDLDKAVKIQGTDYDRKRKVTSSIIKKMRGLEKKGKNYSEIAKEFGFCSKTVRYNLDSTYREFCKMNCSGAHTGKTRLNKTNRVAYKRELVAKGKVSA